MNSSPRLLLLLAPLLVLGRPALPAEPRELVSSLTLEQVVEAARRDNAELHAARARWEAMTERPVQARSLANPTFKYGAMDPTARGNLADADEKRFMIEQEFPWFGKRELRGKVATQDAVALRHDYDALQREVVMAVKESYYDLYGVQQAHSLTGVEDSVLQRLEQVALTRYETGTAAQTDVLKARSERTMLRQQLLEFEQQEATLQARLNQLLNRRADAPLGLAVTPPVDGVTETDAAKLFALAERSRPEIGRAEAGLQRREAERDLMRKEFWPDYRLGVEYRSIRPSEDMVMVTVGFDLPLWRGKYRAGEREAVKLIESSQAEVDAARQQAGFDVQDTRFKLLTARRTLELYRHELIPQAQLRFQASEAGYRTGKVDFLDLLESERFLLNARVLAALAEGNLGKQLARLERAVGTDLNSSVENIK